MKSSPPDVRQLLCMKTQSAALINYYTLGKKSRKLQRENRTFSWSGRSAAYRNAFCLSDIGVRAFFCDFLHPDQQVRIPNNTENGIEMTTGHGLM